MGMDPYVHLGIVVTIKEQEITYDEDVKTCLNTSCSKFQKENKKTAFCPDCGNKILEDVITRKGKQTLEDFHVATDYKYEETLFCTDYMECKNGQMYMDNSGYSIDVQDSAFMSTSEMGGAKAISEYIEENKEFVEELYNFFGSKNVLIEHGLLPYWS